VSDEVAKSLLSKTNDDIEAALKLSNNNKLTRRRTVLLGD
jgi:hypothetical protein